MTGSQFGVCAGALLAEVLMGRRFGTSARKGENGFVRARNCFVARPATKHSRQKCEFFQSAENWNKIAGEMTAGAQGPLYVFLSLRKSASGAAHCFMPAIRWRDGSHKGQLSELPPAEVETGAVDSPSWAAFFMGTTSIRR